MGARVLAQTVYGPFSITVTVATRVLAPEVTIE